MTMKNINIQIPSNINEKDLIDNLYNFFKEKGIKYIDKNSIINNKEVKQHKELSSFWLAAGKISGVFDKNKSAKEIKQELVNKNYK